MPPEQGLHSLQPSVVEFSCYRAYLRALVDAEKSALGMNRQKFASHLGLSGSALTMVLDGQRSLSIRATHRIASALSLGFKEREYLETLVLSAEAGNDAERAYYAERLRSLQASSSEAKAGTKRLVRWDLGPDWLCAALLVHLNDHGLKEGIEAAGWTAPDEVVEEIGAKLGVSSGAVRETLTALAKAGTPLALVPGEFSLRYEKVTSKRWQVAFLKSALEDSMRRLDDRFGDDETLWRAQVFSCGSQTLARFRDGLRRLLEDAVAQGLEDAHGPRLTVHAGVQVYPLASSRDVSE